MIDKTVLGNALKGAYQDFKKEKEGKHKKEEVRSEEKHLREAANVGGWRHIRGERRTEKELKALGGGHKHKADNKGYCKTCGKDMIRGKKEKLIF